MKRQWMAFVFIAMACGCTPATGADAGPDAAASGDAGGLDPSVDGGVTNSRERCDEPGEVCCADGKCGNGLPCTEGLCGFIGCGELGEPCCGFFGGSRGYCHLNNTVCEDGMCVEPGCGSEGYECCFEGPPCREDFVCHEGICLRCGGLGESCCPGHVCDGDLYCLREPNSLGWCLAERPPCGGDGERCCDEGPSCNPGLGCVVEPFSFGICRPGPECGGDGRACCETEPRCAAGTVCLAEDDGERCRRCGGYELPCCDGDTPCGPGLTCQADGLCLLPSP